LICDNEVLGLEHVCIVGDELWRCGAAESLALLLLLHLLSTAGCTTVACEVPGVLQNVGLLELATGSAEVVAGRTGICECIDEQIVEVVLVLVLELVLVSRRDELGVTVESCSCISIMWSPSRMVRFRGAFPDRKSFTCNTYRNNRVRRKKIHCRYET
jgi:hypothetical protein